MTIGTGNQSGATSRPRWTRRPEGSTWGDFGPDDQLGRLNLLTPQKVKEGVAEVKEGLRFCLSLPLDFPGGNALNPRRLPPVLRPSIRQGKPMFNYLLSQEHPRFLDVVSDDLVMMHLQYSTQWDSLAHVGQQFDVYGDGNMWPVYYNGFRAGVHVTGPLTAEDAGTVWPKDGKSSSNARALGVEPMAACAIQGRGVMLDLQAYFGHGRTLVTYAMLEGMMLARNIVVEPGDMVCIHTGFAQAILEMNGQLDMARLNARGACLDGSDVQLLNWVSESGLAALISDNFAVEEVPTRPGSDCDSAHPLHAHCLFKLGVPLAELWHLTPLAQWLEEQGRYRFLLTAPPLRLPGAVGSPVTPVATV